MNKNGGRQRPRDRGKAMKATIKHIDHLNMTVKSIDATADWYGRVFGFKVVEEGLSRGMRWAIIRGGDAMLCIYETPDFRNEDNYDRKVHGVSHFGLRITDRKAWEETVKREHVKFTYPQTRYPHSDSWYVEDPSGYEIEVALWDNDVIVFDRELVGAK